MTRLRPADAASAYKSYLRRLSDMLDDQPFLLGAVPTVADFACYHPLWFTRTRTPSVAWSSAMQRLICASAALEGAA